MPGPSTSLLPVVLPKGTPVSALRGLFFDPSTMAFPIDPATGRLFDCHPVDAIMAFLTGVEKGSIPAAKDIGNVFRARFEGVDMNNPTARNTAGMVAARETYAAPIAAGDVTIDKVVVSADGVIDIAYVNNRTGRTERVRSQ